MAKNDAGQSTPKYTTRQEQDALRRAAKARRAKGGKRTATTMSSAEHYRKRLVAEKVVEELGSKLSKSPGVMEVVTGIGQLYGAGTQLSDIAEQVERQPSGKHAMRAFRAELGAWLDKPDAVLLNAA